MCSQTDVGVDIYPEIAMYATDVRQHHCLMPQPKGGGIIILAGCCSKHMCNKSI